MMARWKVAGELDRPERKADVAIGSLTTKKGRLVAVLVRHRDLPIPRVAVERRKHLGVP